ncbi:MAG TPA: helix-hairpin-helix domain-containing protein [Actinopolymorphaceae bacterium]|jgi:competence protein ComEA
MFGRPNPRHARRRPGARDRALVLRRLDRIAPAIPVEAAIGAHDAALGLDRAGGWVPRGRARRMPADDDLEPDAGHTPHVWEPVDPTAGQPGLTVRLAARFGVSPAHVVLVSVGLVLALVLAGVAFVRARPHETSVALVAVPTASPGSVIAVPAPVPADPAVASRASPGSGSRVPSTSAAATAASLVVHVIGKVRRPGVVRVSPGARVMDAITAAGGAAKGADLSTLNLARLVSDGEQVTVDVPSTVGGSGAPPSVPGGAGGSGASTAVVDLNSADLTVLETLPGVGPVLAQRILDFRTENGRFTRIDELKDVKGIGAKTFADIEPHVTV